MSQVLDNQSGRARFNLGSDHYEREMVYDLKLVFLLGLPSSASCFAPQSSIEMQETELEEEPDK